MESDKSIGLSPHENPFSSTLMLERIRRRMLPHWDVPDAAYFVTSCLDGSLSANGKLDIANYRRELEQRTVPPNTTKAEWKIIRGKLVFARLDRWLDEAPAVRWLERADLANLIMQSFLHGAGTKYDLFTFVVMPSHIHWVFQPRLAWFESKPDSKRSSRQRIVHGLNTHTGQECNRLLDRNGVFWQDEGYDHWIRDVAELERIMLYVENNPVRAGLCAAPEQWQYSSANYRRIKVLAFGEPLI